jgi:hypothetical protein
LQHTVFQPAQRIFFHCLLSTPLGVSRKR